MPNVTTCSPRVPFWRLSPTQFRSSHALAKAKYPALADELITPQPTVRTDEGIFRTRKHGNRSLPMSPLLDDETIKAKHKHAQPKPEQDPESVTAFQKELGLNPHAQALATPVRLCQMTLAHLPTHFLMPFASTVERPTEPSERVKIRLEPGTRASHRDKSQEVLTSTSYLLNRYDAVRHLQRQHHWHHLVTDRQRADVGRMARKGNTYGPKFLREHYVWEDAVEPAREVLEQDVVKAIQALDAETMQCESAAAASSDSTACVLDLNDERATGTEEMPGYQFASLLSAGNLEAVREAVIPHTQAGIIRVLAGPAATRLLVALDKLQAFKDAVSIMKRMPMVQNPPGTRQKTLEEREQAAKDADEPGRDGDNAKR